MSRKFLVQYHEWENDGQAHFQDSYFYHQAIYQAFTIRDVKEFVKRKRYEIHKPVCTCFLRIYKQINKENNQIGECFDYNDSTFLNYTVFNKSNPIFVCANLGKKCSCGGLDILILSSNFEKKREEDIKRWEEKSREDKEYYDRRLREEKDQHQIEINRLNNLIKEQKRESLIQIEEQNDRHKKEIERLHEENNIRENQYLEEKKETKERFINIENQRKQEQKEHNERLKTMENERHRDREEANKKLVNFENERKRERELYTERFKTLEKILEENKQKLEQNENEKKLLKQNEKNAENDFISGNTQIYKEYFEKNKDLITSEIIIKLKKLIDQNISLNNINDDMISKIVKEEKFLKILREYLEDKISNLNNENININSFNIIILGNTGVGKSTLLNTVLKEKLAETKNGDRCTVGPPKAYESEKAKGIRIWDSQGIENGKYNLEIAFKDIKETIQKLIKENDPDKFIHCIWYCIYSNRFIDEEVENLKKYYNSYIEKLPIIIVFTQSDNQKKTDKMMEIVKDKLIKEKNINGLEEKKANDIKILKVLAEDCENDLGVVKSFGIRNLMEQTYESAKMGIESACIHSLMEKGKEMLKEEFNEIIKKLKERIFLNEKEIKEDENINDIEKEQPNNILDNILNDEKKRQKSFNVNMIENFNYNNFKKFCKIISREVTKNLLFKETIKDLTINLIDKVIDLDLEKIQQFLEQIFQTQIEPISNTLTEEMVDFVSSLENKYEISSLSSKYNYNELKRQIKIIIIKNFKPSLEEIIYREISQIIFQKFSDKISEELIICFEQQTKSNKKFREILAIKGKEISLICLEKIKKLMDYPSDNYEERNPMAKKEVKKKNKYEDLEEDEENNKNYNNNEEKTQTQI